MKTAFCFLAALGLASAFVPAAPRMSRGRSMRMVSARLCVCAAEEGGGLIEARVPMPGPWDRGGRAGAGGSLARPP